jgi:hypothetical protein
MTPSAPAPVCDGNCARCGLNVCVRPDRKTGIAGAMRLAGVGEMACHVCGKALRTASYAL